jgi:hypothetical protein
VKTTSFRDRHCATNPPARHLTLTAPLEFQVQSSGPFRLPVRSPGAHNPANQRQSRPIPHHPNRSEVIRTSKIFFLKILALNCTCFHEKRLLHELHFLFLDQASNAATSRRDSSSKFEVRSSRFGHVFTPFSPILNSHPPDIAFSPVRQQPAIASSSLPRRSSLVAHGRLSKPMAGKNEFQNSIHGDPSLFFAFKLKNFLPLRGCRSLTS